MTCILAKTRSVCGPSVTDTDTETDTDTWTQTQT